MHGANIKTALILQLSQHNNKNNKQKQQQRKQNNNNDDDTTTIPHCNTRLVSSVSTVRDKQLTLASQRIVDPSREQDPNSSPFGENST
jgi:hypothetical protein